MALFINMLKNLKVLSLKYRPQIFEDLIGQEIVSKTIYNSIKQNKIPNAFLFTGIRGVGKTTIARIIAKALNCENGLDNISLKFLKDVKPEKMTLENAIDYINNIKKYSKKPVKKVTKKTKKKTDKKPKKKTKRKTKTKTKK